MNPRAVARGNRGAVLAASRDAPEGSVMIHNHPSGDLEPSGADLAVAATLYEAGLGSAIVDNEASGPLRGGGAPGPTGRGTPRPGRDRGLPRCQEGPSPWCIPVSRIAPGSGTWPSWWPVGTTRAGWGWWRRGPARGNPWPTSFRPPSGLSRTKSGPSSPPTPSTSRSSWWGRTFRCCKRGRWGRSLRWSLVKGRGNYVSIRRAHLAAATAPSLFDEDRSGEMEAILDWIETTQDGSLSDLSAPPSEEVWEEVQSDSDICLRTRCPHFQDCFFQRARREAASAEILVVNHHLLFTDLAVRRVTEQLHPVGCPSSLSAPHPGRGPQRRGGRHRPPGGGGDPPGPLPAPLPPGATGEGRPGRHQGPVGFGA